MPTPGCPLPPILTARCVSIDVLSVNLYKYILFVVAKFPPVGPDIILHVFNNEWVFNNILSFVPLLLVKKLECSLKIYNIIANVNIPINAHTFTAQPVFPGDKIYPIPNE